MYSYLIFLLINNKKKFKTISSFIKHNRLNGGFMQISQAVPASCPQSIHYKNDL